MLCRRALIGIAAGTLIGSFAIGQDRSIVVASTTSTEDSRRRRRAAQCRALGPRRNFSRRDSA